MKQFRKSLLMGALISLAGIVSAQTPIPTARGPMPFSAFDQNADGAISRQEFESLHAQRQQTPNPQGYSARRYNDPPKFNDFDRNRDGSLSADEFAQGQLNRMQQRRQQMWGPGQGGNVPRGPGMGQGMGPGMGRGMGPGMGQGMGPGMGRGMGPGMGQGMGPRSGPGMGPGRGRNMPAFSEFDLNADGVLQPQEFEQARAQRIRERAEQGYLMRNLQNAPPFGSIDANGDGVVSPAEFAAAQAAHRQP